MRIALTITDLDPGGAEQTLVQLACYLKRRSHHVQVFALGETNGKTLGDSTLRACLKDQLQQAGIPWLCGRARGITSLPACTNWLQRKLADFGPELVQSMLFHANVVTTLANRRLGLPHVGGARVAQPQYVRRRIQRWAVNGYMDKLVCVSHSVAQECITKERIRADKIVVIPNGISITEESPLHSHLKPPTLIRCLPSDETPFFLFVGRLAKQKGIDLLLRRVDQLLQPLPEHHLVIVGDGALRDQLRAIIDHTSCGNRVHLVGWHPKPLDWMRHAQAILVPSLYEGMPNVVLEAMSIGRPVVAFEVEGVSELLGASLQQIAAPGDFSALIKNAMELGRDQSLANSLGRKNFDRAFHEHRLEDKFALYEQLYQNLLSRNPEIDYELPVD